MYRRGDPGRTIEALGRALACGPEDLFDYRPEEPKHGRKP